MNKKLLALIIAIVVCTLTCVAQDSVEAAEAAQHFHLVVKWIRYDSISKLAGLINFPLKRENPLPDISTRDEFIMYYPILIDSQFKRKLLDYDDSDIFYHNGSYGLVGGKFWGEIWIDEDGKIETINYRSDKEIELQMHLTSEIQNQIYPSVKAWKKNILVCETEKYLVRVDMLDNDDLRYVAWRKPKIINEKPDVILYNGVQEFQGTMGGVTYTFHNNRYYYQIDEVDMAESENEIGLFLRMYKSKKDLANFKPLNNFRCRELK
jgi:hypothetical protein